MKLLSVTLADAAANIALDDALVEEADEKNNGDEIVRLWEPASPLVVLGRSSRLAAEVNVEACRQRGIPVVRRASGGATIVAGSGCLMYAVIASYVRRPELRAIDAAHRFFLGHLAAALTQFAPTIEQHGTSDLAITDENGRWRKVSGNSMRCRREHVLYHGTLLYDFSLDLVSELLLAPPRQPEYRAGRNHESFLANLPLSAAQLRQAVLHAFDATNETTDWPKARTETLVREKYATDRWTNLS